MVPGVEERKSTTASVVQEITKMCDYSKNETGYEAVFIAATHVTLEGVNSHNKIITAD